MFEIDLPEPEVVRGLDDAGLVDAIIATSKLESAVQARRLSAVGELWDRRKQQADDGEREYFFIDTREAVAAEIAAAVGVTSARASGLIRVGEALRDRLPRVAAVFARGDIDLAMVFAIVYRTELIDDDDAVARIDAELARRAPGWTKYSRKKIAEYIDSWVGRFDPVWVREPKKPTEDRYLDVRSSSQGMAGIWGNLNVNDAIEFDGRIDVLTATVCPKDPRTKAQLRADAVRPLANRQDFMTCLCGSDDCTAEKSTADQKVVIHVIAESSTVDGDGEAPGYVDGFGPIAADTVRDLARTARRKPLVIPTGLPAECGYRPSTALAEFVRSRDLFCRFPGCDVPATLCDIDHTVPYVLGGLTHASNMKCECRKHHLLKTFYVGPGGWFERQLPDGTVEWVAPTGHVYVTKPGGQLYFPALSQPTGELPDPPTIILPHPGRSEMMPRRQRTRAEETARRLADERQRNADRLSEQARIRAEQEARDDQPPPPF
ncbi:hypothetical protein TUM20985_30480 [Mycobacterium antarcticum]|uniref:HNH endonuclease signature motif containing protein n=1 Tax=Mycolicibacterium sp. TUM20985 TaxID=3023370 RepID=UPI002572FACE|nr:DUF222 domain-containing protein [Mycolicibacterium sp. TUM20985]BDX32501.1 hypothetical protein TUM20985_30480 [Mycolicibacterium sp. TUM20985]